MRTHCLTALILSCILVPCSVTAEMDRERMRSDLDMMETVLQQLMSHPADPLGNLTPRESIHGVHLDGYGVVFLVGYGRSWQRWIQRDHLLVAPDGKEAEGTDVTAPVSGEEPANALQDKAVEFFTRYAGTIDQLKANERVTLVLRKSRVWGAIGPYDHLVAANFDVALPSVPFQFEPDTAKGLEGLREQMEALRARAESTRARVDSAVARAKASAERAREAASHAAHLAARTWMATRLPGYDRAPAVVMSASVRDIERLAEKKLDKASFEERLVVQTTDPDDNASRALRIFSAILNEGIAMGAERLDWPAGQPTAVAQHYIDGLGALFFVKAPPAPHPSAIRLSSVFTLPTQGPWSESRARLRQTLTDILADYGSTVSPVKGSERIVIHVDAGWAEEGGEAIRKLFSAAITRAALEDLERGRIGREEFKRRVEMLEL